MDEKLHKAVSELDEFIALCRKRLDDVLSGLNWTENVTLRDIGAKKLEREDHEDEDDPPLPQSFGCENSVVIGVDQLKAIINAETASIAKKFSDIQLNYTREQKREIYDYVIHNTRKLSEPEVKVTVSNNQQPTTNMTIAQIVAKAKANAKIQRRKYSTSKPTHIEEVREMLHLQMQALNQLYKPKTEKPHTNTCRKPHLDMHSPSSGDSCEGRSVFRRPSLDMVIRLRSDISGHQSDERRGRDKHAKNSTACRRYSQSGGQVQSGERHRNPTSPCTSAMHKESGQRDLNDCGWDLSNAGQDRRSLKERKDGRFEENATEKDKMRSSGRRKGQSRDKRTRRDKRSHEKVERLRKRDRGRGDKHKSLDKRYPSSCSSESGSQSSRSNTSSSRCKYKAKRTQVSIKREHKSRSKSKETRRRHRGSKKSAKRSSRSRNRSRSPSCLKIQDNIKCPSKLPKPPQHQPSPKKSKRGSKSRAQDEKQQPSMSSSIEKTTKRSRWDSLSASDTWPSSRASQETNTKRSKDTSTTRSTSKDIDQMLNRLQNISKKDAPKTVQVNPEPGRI